MKQGNKEWAVTLLGGSRGQRWKGEQETIIDGLE